MLVRGAAESAAGSFPLLTALIVTPIAGAALTAVLPKRRPELARVMGLVVSAATLGFAIWLLVDFRTGEAGYQLLEEHSWMSDLGVGYVLGVDGISLFMVALNALLFPLAFIASVREHDQKSFAVWMLLLEGALMGVFLALDFVLFFVFFELVLVPMYFLIAGWGYDRRRYAAMKFFIFTMAGSAFLFVGILALGFLHQSATGDLTFDVRVLTDWSADPSSLSSGTAKLLFLAFFAAFAVKVPLVPLHTWLPDAHTEAPTAGSVVLAGVLLKMGTYGFLRFSLPMFPQAAVDLAPLLLVLGTIGIVYGAIVATMQPDLKRLVAYSSIAHLGFVIIGTFALTRQGLQGGVFTMLSHGLTTGALFLLVGMLSERRHTRRIADFGGLMKSVPVLSGMFLVAALASLGLPGFSGFVGEFLALLGTFVSHRWYAVVAAAGVILAALYLLWAVQRSFMGEPEGPNRDLPDISARELLTVVPLLGLSLFLGFHPRPVLDRVEPSIAALVTQVEDHSDWVEPDVSELGPDAPEVATSGSEEPE
jgi:NADH-quinone oxidoreductase subunit M